MDEIADGSIIAFHLASGQTVLAKVTKSDDYGFHIEKPMEFLSGMTQHGPQFALIPYLTCSGAFPPIEQMILAYEDVVMPRPAPAPLEQKYQEDTGMIVTPPQGLVLVKP